MATRGVNPYEDRSTASDEQVSSRGTNPNARGVAPEDPYADERDTYSAPKKTKTTAKSTAAATQPAATTQPAAKGTVGSSTINTSNPYGGNVTKYGGMSDEELMLLYHNGIDSNNWLGYDLDPLRYELRSRGMAEAADNVNAFRNKKIDANDLGYDLEYWNERTQRYEPRTLKAPTLEAGTAGYYPDDIYDWFYNAAERSRDERTKTIDEQSKNQEDMIRAQYEYAIWKAQQELKNSLENGKARYNQAVAQNAISSLQAADNLALRNAAAGDMGGIGGKLYSDQQASFDAQLGDIRNEELRLYNETEQQAALLEAQGRYEEAQAIRQIGAEKLQYLLNMQDELWNAGREDYKWLMNYGMNYQQQTRDIEQQALQNALTRLQLGILGPEDFTALGVSQEEAAGLANYYKQLADLNLEEAKISLQSDMAKLAGYTAPRASGSGYSAGGGGGDGGYTPSLHPGGTNLAKYFVDYGDSVEIPAGQMPAFYADLLASGAMDYATAYNQIINAIGRKNSGPTVAKELATGFAEWLDEMENGTGFKSWDYETALKKKGYTRNDMLAATQYLMDALGINDAERAEVLANAYFTQLENAEQEAKATESRRAAGGIYKYIPALADSNDLSAVGFTNRTGKDWIVLTGGEGHGRISLSGLNSGVAQGTIILAQNPDGSYTAYDNGYGESGLKPGDITDTYSYDRNMRDLEAALGANNISQSQYDDLAKELGWYGAYGYSRPVTPGEANTKLQQATSVNMQALAKQYTPRSVTDVEPIDRLSRDYDRGLINDEQFSYINKYLTTWYNTQAQVSPGGFGGMGEEESD